MRWSFTDELLVRLNRNRHRHPHPEGNQKPRTDAVSELKPPEVLLGALKTEAKWTG